MCACVPRVRSQRLRTNQDAAGGGPGSLAPRGWCFHGHRDAGYLQSDCQAELLWRGPRAAVITSVPTWGWSDSQRVIQVSLLGTLGQEFLGVASSEVNL